MLHLKSDYFLKQSSFKLKLSSIFLFIIAALIGWGINIFGSIVFPTQSLIPYFARTTIQLITILALIVVTIRLLKQNYLAAETLGLKLSGKSFLNFLWGVFIGIATLGLIAALLYAFVPYHFIAGPLNGLDVLKECYSYLLSNFLEELIFRGLLLIIFSQLIGWRKAVWIMAVPFGLFHLQGLGLSLVGLKMIITTAAYSFVFSYAYILTGSMWTAIGVHVSSNILLHAIIGLDGANKAMFVPVFTGRWPVGYDLGFVLFLMVSIAVATVLFLLIRHFQKMRSIHLTGIEA